MNKRLAAIAFLLALCLICTACSGNKPNDANDSPKAETADDKPTGCTDDNSGSMDGVIGIYEYPSNPAEELKAALESDIGAYNLSMKIGDIERVEFDDQLRSQFRITFPDSENVCVVYFPNDYFYVDFGDGVVYDEPSFVMAFKEPDNSQDMLLVLAPVLRYLSPVLSVEESERLALKQDMSISTDGYSMPHDISGYQVQTLYTNPHVCYHVPDFDAKLVVKATALRQMWGMWSMVDTNECYEMTTPDDFKLLSAQFWPEGDGPEFVYADFTVKNVWQRGSYLHGEVWEMIEVETADGQQFFFSVDTMRQFVYEFGVGQQYTVFIWLPQNIQVIHAVQRTEASGLNSRGKRFPLEYHDSNWKDEALGFEPNEGDTVYEVTFQYQDRFSDEVYEVLAGHSIGEQRWINDPERDEYTFVGWYDIEDWNGEPYTKDRPINKDVSLYAKWKYAGLGGAWPRAYRGDIQGVNSEGSLSVGEALTISASGYNMDLEYIRDQRFRWKPISWRLSDGTNGSFSADAPFEAEIPLGSKGEQRLFITYSEEIFDRIEWQPTGQLHEVEEALLTVN